MSQTIRLRNQLTVYMQKGRNEKALQNLIKINKCQLDLRDCGCELTLSSANPDYDPIPVMQEFQDE